MHDDQPDVTGFYLLHRAMVVDAHRLRARLASLRITEGEHRRRLVPWFDLYRDAVQHHHHRVEEAVGFTDERRQELDDLLAEVGDGLERLASSGGFRSVVAARDEVHGTVAALSALLDDHVLREEAQVVPRLVHERTALDLGVLAARAQRDLGTAGVAQVLPWLASHLTAEERGEQWRQVPVTLRARHRAGRWQQRYDDLAAPLRVGERTLPLSA